MWAINMEKKKKHYVTTGARRAQEWAQRPHYVAKGGQRAQMWAIKKERKYTLCDHRRCKTQRVGDKKEKERAYYVTTNDRRAQKGAAEKEGKTDYLRS